MLLAYLEHTGIIGQSISAKKAAMTAALEAQQSDSDDDGYNEKRKSQYALNLDDYGGDGGDDNDDDGGEDSEDGKQGNVGKYF